MSSEDVDKHQKTEEATPKRLGDAHTRGDVPKSQDVNNWFMIAASALVLAVFGNYVASGVFLRLGHFLESAHGLGTDLISLRAAFFSLAQDIGGLLFTPIAILMTAAVAGNLVQHKWIWTLEKIKPKLSGFNPVSGLKSKFSPNAAVEFLKDLLKMVVMGAALATVIWPERNQLYDIMGADLTLLLPLIKMLVLQVVVAVLVVLALLALLDFQYQKYEQRKKLKMTKQEVKDERKQTEGDPKIKRRILQIRLSRLRQRMMAAVPEADVVITNPTHYAVALQYMSEAMEAPKVLAKGRDLVALRIREIAEENGVPIVENPSLARALHDSAEINQEIPVEHYKAVAEVIGFIMGARGGLRSARRHA